MPKSKLHHVIAVPNARKMLDCLLERHSSLEPFILHVAEEYLGKRNLNTDLAEQF